MVPFFKSEEEKQKTAESLANQILDQIKAHIDKNTFFPRTRFGRKEEELLANDQICVNCDSTLTNPDFCIHCGQQYERKPGTTTLQLGQTGIPSSNVMGANAPQSSGINIPLGSLSSFALDSKKLALMPPPQPLHKAHSELIPSAKPIPAVHHEEIMAKPPTLKQRIQTEYIFSGKERKVCKKCNEVNPFFKNECFKCKFKFPKTRGLHNSALSSDSYSLYFWDMLHSDPVFSQLDQVNDFLEEKDFMCVRDLYTKLKQILSQPNTERIFDISDTELLGLHASIDEKFEICLTDNPLTETIFNDATAMRTQRKRVRQVMFNFREAQAIFDRKKSGRENVIDLYNDEGEMINDEDDQARLLGKRKSSPMSLGQRSFLARRPYNRPLSFESQHLTTMVGNINLLHQMGFLDHEVLSNEYVNRIMIENDSANAFSNVRKRGRPRKFDLTYDDMLTVDQWDDTKLIFQQNLINAPGAAANQDDEDIQGPVLQANGQLTSAPQKKQQVDGNVDVCGVCYNPGKLICCDDCPAAFHAECLGYERQFPRGKWKCYYCKVAKYGLKQVPRMAPSEKPVCDALSETLESWEDKALHMLDILENYQCMSVFFDKVELTPEQIEHIRQRRNIEGEDLGIPQTVQDIYQKVAASEAKFYQKWEDFYAELKDGLNFYFTFLDKRDLVHLEARSCLVLLQKLVEENEIFTLYVQAPVVKRSVTKAQAKPKETARVTRAQLGKSFNIRENVKDSASEPEDDYQQEVEEDQTSQAHGLSDFEVSIDSPDKEEPAYRARTANSNPNGRQTRSAARK